MPKPTTFKYGTLDASAVNKSAAYTVVADTDSGKTFFVKDADVTFTLPAITIGQVFTFVFTGSNGRGSITLSPQAADGITYKGSQTDDKDLILTKATAKTGDFVKIASIDQVVAWQVTEARGIWAKQA